MSNQVLPFYYDYTKCMVMKLSMANDHGGTGQGHGEQSAQERTTWIATNRKLDTAWYSVGYDGYNVQQGG